MGKIENNPPLTKGGKGGFAILLTIIILSILSPSYTSSQEKATAALRPPIPEGYKDIRNPLPRSAENILEGERLYDTLCSRCHGGNMDGKGPEASGFFPSPADLVTLLSQVKPHESYLFWRIKEGGRGLPRGFVPWNSAMPVWKEELTDDKIWKIIIYLYEAIGAAPP